MKYLLIVELFLVGCSSSKLELSDNTASNISVVASYVPIGTDVASAVTRMADAGFACKIERDMTISLAKGTNVLGQIESLDLVLCQKQAGPPVSRRWTVILILDEQDKVKEHSVTTGLVGP